MKDSKPRILVVDDDLMNVELLEGMLSIVMVTALKEKEDRIKSIEAGADDFLSKPVDMYELSARVKSLLRVKQYYDAFWYSF